MASREGAPCSLCLSLQPQGAHGVSVIFSRQCFFLREFQEGGKGAARARFFQARAYREGSIPGFQPKGGSLRGYPASGEMGSREEGKWWRILIPSVFQQLDRQRPQSRLWLPEFASSLEGKAPELRKLRNTSMVTHDTEKASRLVFSPSCSSRPPPSPIPQLVGCSWVMYLPGFYSDPLPT